MVSKALSTLFAALLIVAFALGQGEAAKLKPGDQIAVIVAGMSGYDTEAVVLTDGSINGRGFGRLVVEGKTVAEVGAMVLARLKKVLQNPDVTVLLKSQRLDVVYVSGAKTEKGGPVELVPGMKLRQLLASVELPGDTDLLDVQIFRTGSDPMKGAVDDTLRGGSQLGDTVLKPNDVIVVSPQQYVRIWVTGAVARPGELRVKQGTDIYRAVAAAGGVDTKLVDSDDLQVMLRRGPELKAFPGKQHPGDAPTTVEAGDTIVVQTPPTVRVTVGGKVQKPGEYALRGGASILQAIAQAGGRTQDAMNTSVVVLRQGEAIQTSALPVGTDGKPQSMPLQDGDLVYVPTNELLVVAVGAVKKPGRILLAEGKKYRVSDVLAEAGGLDTHGSLRHVYYGHPGVDGKFVVKEIALDKYLKDGDEASNPHVTPGDVVLFGEPKGVGGSAIQQVLSSALVFLGLFRR